jgi:hypothetical protein
MPRDAQRRYAQAVWYAVDEKDVTLDTADQFGDWYTRVGHLHYGDDITAAFESWVSMPNTTK